MEQKLVVFMVEASKPALDVTSKVESYLAEGWRIVSVQGLGATANGLAFMVAALLEKSRRGWQGVLCQRNLAVNAAG